MEQHVAEMWTIDPAECLAIAHANGLLLHNLDEDGYLPELSAPKGLLVIIRLKTSYDHEINKKAEVDNEINKCVRSESQFDKYTHEDDDLDSEEEEGEDDEETVRQDPSRTIKFSQNHGTEKLIRQSMMFNPLRHSLSPFCPDLTLTSQSSVPTPVIAPCPTPTALSPGFSYSIEPTCIAIFAPTGSKVSAALTSALVTWRAALRSQDIPHHRGGGGSKTVDSSGGVAIRSQGSTRIVGDKKEKEENGSIPLGILRAFIAAMDMYSIADSTSRGIGLSLGLSRDTSGGLGDIIYDESIAVPATTIVAAAAANVSGIPGTGFLAMR